MTSSTTDGARGFPGDFSDRRSIYARYQPTYPPTLFEALAAHTPGRRRALDCAIGGGQTAVGLSDWFDEIIAIDPGEPPLPPAAAHPKIRYVQATPDRSGLPDGSVDLVAVAAALHRLALDTFYPEVRRVLRPNGVVAAWGYGAQIRVSETIDPMLKTLIDETLGRHWPRDCVHLRDRYRRLPFPFERIDMPALDAEAEMDLGALIGHIHTWSGYRAYLARAHRDPLEDLELPLTEAWASDFGSPRAKTLVRWPLHFLVGRV